MTEVETTNDELIIRRTFDAPRERVWKAFTEADELEEWFVPEGMTAEVTANEVEPGGEMAIHWTDDENRIENEGYYVEVDEYERLVSGEETTEGELRVTYEFRDVDDGTEVVVTQEFPGSVPDGAAEGWAGMLDALADLFEARSTDIETNETSLTIRRTFDAPRERVWEVWTDPDHVDRWWGPDGFSTTTDEMDVRSGGVWAFEMVGPDGEAYPNRIAYDEVERPKRLAYTQGSPDNPEQFEVTVTFEAEEDEGETALVMEMRFPSATDLDEAVDLGADDGAKQTLGKLADHLRGDGPSGGAAKA